MIKRISKVLATSLLIVCMMGGTVSAAPVSHSTHQYEHFAYNNISSWLIQHLSKPLCYEYHWVSREEYRCVITGCPMVLIQRDTEHWYHTSCGLPGGSRTLR